MSLFSLDFFKSEKRKQLEEENRLLKKQLEQEKEEKAELYEKKEELINEIESWSEEKVIQLEKPYSKLFFVNNTLTVVMQDDSVLVKSNASKEDYQAISTSTSKEEIEAIMIAKEVLEERAELAQEIKKVTKVREGFTLLEESGYFEIKDNSVYFKGINRSLPELLVNKFVEILSSNKEENLEGNVEFLAHKRFFLWCCCNPRAEVSDRLYDFLHKNGMKITKEGLFVALRNVVKKDDCNHELVEFISNCYNKVRSVWKKRSSSFLVYKDENSNYQMISSKTVTIPENLELLGNLEDLYLNLSKSEENNYTDNWSKTFSIKVGQKVSMKPEDCDWSTQDCATKGLSASPSI